MGFTVLLRSPANSILTPPGAGISPVSPSGTPDRSPVRPSLR